jgi:hypothetical protein
MKYNWWQTALVQLTIVFVLFVLFAAGSVALGAECDAGIELRYTDTGVTFCTDRGCHPEYTKVGEWTYVRIEQSEFETRQYVVQIVDGVVSTSIYIDGKLAQQIPPLRCAS